MNPVPAEAPLRIEPASATALDVLAELQADAFDAAWGREGWAKLLATPGAFALIASLSAPSPPEPVGFVLCRAGGAECEMLSIGTRATARRRGHGRALLAASMAWAAEMGTRRFFLEVAVDNAPARALYLAQGFREVGRRPGYYQRTAGAVAAVVLARDLTP